jgi:hypothetical protein
VLCQPLRKKRIMARKLRAKSPANDEHRRLKFFCYGPSGWGKTVNCIQLFPQAVIIDTERGTEPYADLIQSQGSVVLHSNDADEIAEELRALLTTEHEYRSVIIDPITVLYQTLQDKWDQIFARKFERRGDKVAIETQDWGITYWQRVKNEHKKINNLVAKLDMNVAMTAHTKPVYGENFKVTGQTFDGIKGLDYFFDVVFQLYIQNGKRYCNVVKERAMPGKSHFPATFEWNMAMVREAWGIEELNRASTPIEMALESQVNEVTQLLDILTLPDSVIAKWFTKANAENWSDFSAIDIGKCIDYLKAKLPKPNEVIV